MRNEKNTYPASVLYCFTYVAKSKILIRPKRYSCVPATVTSYFSMKTKNEVSKDNGFFMSHFFIKIKLNFTDI